MTKVFCSTNSCVSSHRFQNFTWHIDFGYAITHLIVFALQINYVITLLIFHIARFTRHIHISVSLFTFNFYKIRFLQKILYRIFAVVASSGILKNLFRMPDEGGSPPRKSSSLLSSCSYKIQASPPLFF